MNTSKDALKDALFNIEKEARRGGLLVNESKTKYMQVARVVHNDKHLCCGQHKFEHIKEISYLCSPIPSVVKSKPGFSVQTNVIMHMGTISGTGEVCPLINYFFYKKCGRSQLPRGLRRGSAAARQF